MRIVQVSTWDTACGIAHYTGFLREALEARGHDVTVVPIDRDEARYLARRELRGHFGALAERIPESDVVHIQHEFGFFGGRYGYGTSVREFTHFLRAVARPGRRVVVTFHTDPLIFLRSSNRPLDMAGFAVWASLWRASLPPLLNRRRHVTAVVHTRTARAGMIDSGVRPDRIALVPHGIPEFPALSSQERHRSRSGLGIAAEETVLGVFGFLARYKGHLTAVRALRRLPESYRLLLVGGQHPESDDPALEDILSYLDEYPELAPRVTITGYGDDARTQSWLAACDVMLAPYAPGTTVMASGALGRSLATGLPVIASAIPSFVELARHAHCLELTAPGSPHQLAATIERLAADPERRAALAAAAGDHVRTHSWSRVGELHERLYESRPLPEQITPPPPAPRAASPGLVYHGPTTEVDLSVEGEERPPVLRRTRVGPGRELTFVLAPDRFADPLVEALVRRGFADDPPNVLVRQLLRPGDRFVDVGAHVGTFALPAAAQGADVIALDASSLNARLLRAAVAINDLGERCRVVHGVVAERSGAVEHFAEEGLFGSVATAEEIPGSNAVEVRTVAVDDVLAEAGWDRADLVKVDVEGFELHALAGMRRLLAGSGPTLVVECNAKWLGKHGATTRELMLDLEELGYALHTITRTEPGRLAQVSSDDVQTEAVVDLVAWKQQPANLGPWYVSPPYDAVESAARLRTAATQPAAEYRKYAALAIVAAPPAVRDQRDNVATLEALKWDRDEEVREAALGLVDPESFGVPRLSELRSA